MATALLALAYTLSSAMAQEAKDPETVLQAYDAELQKGIRTAPKDPALRTKLIAAANPYVYAPTTKPMTEDLPWTPVTRKGKVRAAMDERLTRRGTLLRFGGLVAAGLGVDAIRSGDGPAAVAAGRVRCVAVAIAWTAPSQQVIPSWSTIHPTDQLVTHEPQPQHRPETDHRLPQR